MAKYKSKGPLTYDLGYLMSQLGVRTAAQRNGQTAPPAEAEPAQPDAMPQFDAEPATYDHTPTDPARVAHDAALRQMLEGLR